MSVYIGGTKVAGLEKELPAQAGNAGKYLYTDGQNASWQEASTAQIWIGTRAEYEALGTYDPEVVYQVTDDFQNLIPNVGQITEDVNNLKAHAVVEFQAPTAENNYTWYRKYADGWVEQGGYLSNNGTGVFTVNLPVTMTDTNYTVNATLRSNTISGGGGSWANANAFSTEQIQIVQDYKDTWVGQGSYWTVSGMAA